MYKQVDSNPDFVEMEKKWLKKWDESGVIHKYLHKNDKSEKHFSFLDGPITANNPMGVHHAWGRTYKDIWQRFYNLLGFRQRFQNGFDCQGLWVEVEVEKELGLNSKKDIENLVPGDKKASIAAFVQLCKDRVLKFAAIQTQQTQRLGNFMDWDHSYFTMSPENNYMIWHFLKKCYENGWIYKGRDSVPWCPRCETAISQHEMLSEDYKELVHDSVYLKLPINDRDNEYLLVWTTTPWTIPANIAVAVDSKLEYVLVDGEGGASYWIAKDAIERVLGKEQKIIKTAVGKELVGMAYEGPYDELAAVSEVRKQNSTTFHTVIATDQMILPITADEGTGLVHTAVSAGVEDFKLGKKYGLPMIEVIGDNANYLSHMGFLGGKNAKKHPEIIIDFLKNHKGGRYLFKTEKYKHRYPACWRCKTELVWKVADEWYIAMDKPVKKQTLRQMMVEVAKKIHWMPEFGLDRELDWLGNMHDWLISKKNRYWGLALPIYECASCGHFEVIGSYTQLKERAVKGWEQFEGHTPHKPYIDEVKIMCSHCGEMVSRILDVGNPWLDAGIVPYSTITKENQGEPLYLTDKKEWERWFPADFITESFPGQFKNWFYSLIAMSGALESKEPFKTVLGFGTLLGQDGRPMHKSWGNAIEFDEGADKIGVDVMRWMYGRQNPADNMLFGYTKADEVRRQFFLILWNSYRFFVEYANLDEFTVDVIASPAKQSQSMQIATSSATPRNDKREVLDQWILSRLYWLVECSGKNLKNYNLRDVAYEVEKFVDDLSTWYIRRSRDRINGDDMADKQVLYTTLHESLVTLSIIISPMMPFVSDEIYTNLTGHESVHLAAWPQNKPYDQDLIADMQLVRDIVEIGHRERKSQSLKLRQPLQKAEVLLATSVPFKKQQLIDEYQTLIAQELNVKEVTLTGSQKDAVAVVLDTHLTDALKNEGEARELVRKIQQERKRLGLKQGQKAVIILPEYPEAFKDFIQKRVTADSIERGAFSVSAVD